ncbi:hypothetical protein [Niabella sp.]|uniref:hypothetical protein n=1 Tax=Niabella sp. TaxID=1962976 RepID=UPI002615EC5A|nr:hypothetical protein [Niabella sp.]
MRKRARKRSANQPFYLMIWLARPFGEKSEARIAELAQFQLPYRDMRYYTLAKGFLNSHDPLKKHYYQKLPVLDLPGGDLNNQEEGQLKLF